MLPAAPYKREREWNRWDWKIRNPDMRMEGEYFGYGSAGRHLGGGGIVGTAVVIKPSQHNNVIAETEFSLSVS